jgi:eukaryotic-like serine/threonine-protein kinase
MCRQQTPLVYCPEDWCPTVVATRAAEDLREYRKDQLIGGRYRIIEPLGKGAATVVFDTEHIGTGQPVAIKLLSVDPRTGDGMDLIQRFFREARICASLNHANTVQVFDVGQDERGAMYIAMERLTGETMSKVMQRKIIADETLSQGETVAIALGVLEALSAAHELGLVHRDLNPANIMLCLDKDGNQNVKVLDFGVARIENSALTRAGQLPGSPRYMSPEQCSNRKVDGRSDLYSVGCLLFALVAGRPPFEARNPISIMKKHILEPVPDVHELSSAPLSPRFVAILKRALEKDPAARFQTAGDMRAALKQLNVARRRSGRRMDSGSADEVRQAKVLMKMAQQADDPAVAYEYAKTAMKLDPRNLEARKIARGTLANIRGASGTMPIPAPPDVTSAASEHPGE